MSATGTHAIDGIDWRPRTSEPAVSLTAGTRAMATPRATPAPIAIARPASSLQSVVATPASRLESAAPRARSAATSSGDGRSPGGSAPADEAACHDITRAA